MNKINFIAFPAVSNASDDGLLAMGGDLTVDSLVSAYSQGIFPWFNHDQPILWWSPDPRLVLFPSEVRISRSLKKKIRQQQFEVSANQAFTEVIKSCAFRGMNLGKNQSKSLSREDTWITDSMQEAYTALHQQGYAHSIEVWEQGILVGGLYGLVLGKVFFGESMFSVASDASKVALATLCAWLRANDYEIIDCQVSNGHLLSLGAREIARSEFLTHLRSLNIEQPTLNFAQDISQLDAETVIKQQ